MIDYEIAYTHGGTFHADDAMASAILRTIIPNLVINRVLCVPENLPENVIVYDIGEGEFDHHQKGGNGVRKNGVPYASAGIIWNRFGCFAVAAVCPALSNVHILEIVDSIDIKLIQGIDADDNGRILEKGLDGRYLTISEMVSSLNPLWNEAQELAGERFEQAIELCQKQLIRMIKSQASMIDAQEIVKQAILNRPQEEYMILERFCPWQGHLFAQEGTEKILYVIFPSLRGGWSCQAVPPELGSYGQRLPFPENWRGQKPQQLQNISGVADATFCHLSGFLASAATLEGAVALAKASIKQSEKIKLIQ